MLPLFLQWPPAPQFDAFRGAAIDLAFVPRRDRSAPVKNYKCKADGCAKTYYDKSSMLRHYREKHKGVSSSSSYHSTDKDIKPDEISLEDSQMSDNGQETLQQDQQLRESDAEECIGDTSKSKTRSQHNKHNLAGAESKRILQKDFSPRLSETAASPSQDLLHPGESGESEEGGNGETGRSGAIESPVQIIGEIIAESAMHGELFEDVNLQPQGQSSP